MSRGAAVDLQRFCIKLFARPPAGFDDGALIPVFHGWIRREAPLGTLIDVTDYRHVPQGPGVMLIAHEANFALDRAEGDQLGLLYQRKTPQDAAALSERVLGAAAQAVAAASMLAAEVGLTFDAGTLRFIANDRLLAPNNGAAYAALEAQLREAGERLYGACGLERASPDPRERLAVDVTARGAVTLETLAARRQVAG